MKRYGLELEETGGERLVMAPDENGDWVRYEDVEQVLKRQASAAIAGMNAAKAISSAQVQQAHRLKAESSPESLESERAANALLTAEIEQLRGNLSLAEEGKKILHGEIAKMDGCTDRLAEELANATQTTERLRTALEMIYDKWENGVPCFEDADNTGSGLGNAFKLTQEEEMLVLSLIPAHASEPLPAASFPVLPIDPKADAIVDRLVSQRLATTSARPLRAEGAELDDAARAISALVEAGKHVFCGAGQANWIDHDAVCDALPCVCGLSDWLKAHADLLKIHFGAPPAKSGE